MIDIEEKPTLYIVDKAFRKIKVYEQATDEEILGLLTIEEIDEGLLITDILIPQQEVTGASCEPTVDGLAEVINDLGKPELIRGWWHLHPGFSTSPSGIDINTIRNWSGGDIPYVVTLISSKEGDLSTRIDIFKPIRMTLKKVPLEILWYDDDIKKACEAEIKTKVKPKTFVEKVRQRFGHPSNASVYTPYSQREPNQCPYVGTKWNLCRIKDYTKCAYAEAECPYKVNNEVSADEREENSNKFWDCPYQADTHLCQTKDYRSCRFSWDECPFNPLSRVGLSGLEKVNEVEIEEIENQEDNDKKKKDKSQVGVI